MSVSGLRRAPPATAPRLGRWVGIGGVVGLLALGMFVGAGLGAPALLSPGPTETAQGADVGQQGLTYWVWQSTQLWHIPTPVPTTLSLAVATPTLLSTVASAYTINPALAGNESVRWAFQETTAAPRSTELELRFLDGLTGGAVALRIYVETRATAVPAALVFELYWDAGAFAPASVTVETMQVDVLACTSVGNCP